LAVRIGVIKARVGKAESREDIRPGNTESQRAQSREGRKPGRQKAGKAESREGRKPGRHKAGKHRVTENTERKIAMVGACLGVDDSFKDLQWTVLDATV
jgi:hypothetical protein